MVNYFKVIGDCNNNDDENLSNKSCQHPLAGFTYTSKNMPKGVGRFSSITVTTLS